MLNFILPLFLAKAYCINELEIASILRIFTFSTWKGLDSQTVAIESLLMTLPYKPVQRTHTLLCEHTNWALISQNASGTEKFATK